MEPRILLWDIETSPCEGYFWGPSWNTTISYEQIKTHAKVIMVSYKWAGEDKVHNIKWPSAKGRNDKYVLKKFSKVLQKADLSVFHNGDKFDLPWINGQLLRYRLPPIDEVLTEDTYKLAKKKFRLPSYKLDDLGDYLGVGRKVPTGGLKLWIRIMEGDNEALKEMETYCNGDVQLLESVWYELTPYTKRKYGLYGPNVCNDCGHDGFRHNKTWHTVAGSERVSIKCTNKKCGSHRTVSGAAYRRLLGE